MVGGAKRSRRQRGEAPASKAGNCASQAGRDVAEPACLLALPREVLERVLSTLDAMSLVQLGMCCQFFRARDRFTGFRFVEKIARDLVVEACGLELAQRFRRLSWLERLYIEDAAVGFDTARWEEIAAAVTQQQQQQQQQQAAAAQQAAPAAEHQAPQQQQQQQQPQQGAAQAAPQPPPQQALAGQHHHHHHQQQQQQEGVPVAEVANAVAQLLQAPGPAAGAAGGPPGQHQGVAAHPPPPPNAVQMNNAQANAFFSFKPSKAAPLQLSIELQGMGPKMLVSDLSTAQQPVLRWRILVRGNTAVEFGVVPLCLEDEDKALHKAQGDWRKFARLVERGHTLPDAERPVGFCSSITVGSTLSFKTAVMKGTVVELVARRGRLEVLIQNPEDAQELYWQNTRTVPKPYKGPREVRFEHDFPAQHDVKLALTSWAHGAFDVLHPVQLGAPPAGGGGPLPRRMGAALICWRRSGTGSSLHQQQWRSTSCEVSATTSRL